MTGRVQTLRSNVTGQRPTGRQPGELYVNWADAQLGSVVAGGAPQDLIAVRFFSTTANYAIGDFAIQGGQLYRAVAPSAAGAFKPANWGQIGGSITAGDAAPSTPQPGTLWWDSVGGQLYVWFQDANSAQWVIATNTANFPSITVGVIPPLAPTVGALWWDSNGAQLYIWYSDGTSSQWVPSVNQLGGNFQSLTGVTDGSDAPAGQIGEIMQALTVAPIAFGFNVANNMISLPLTPGDWDVYGEFWPNITGLTTPGQMYVGITLTSGVMPNGVSLTTARNAMASNPASLQGYTMPVGPLRLSLAAPANVYLVGQLNAASGTSTASSTGKLWARRPR